MKIEAYYLDGRFEVYDTEAHFNASSALGAANCMTTYSIKGASTDGLWVTYSFYDISESRSFAGHDAQCAPLQRAVDVQVLDEEDLKGVAWILVDGLKRFFRLHEGEPLIDGFRFDTTCDVYVGTRELAAIEDKAFDAYMVLHGEGTRVGAMPREENETEEQFNARIASRMGWPTDVLMKTIENVRDRSLWDEEDGVEDSSDSAPAFGSESGDAPFVAEGVVLSASAPAAAESESPETPPAPAWAATPAHEGTGEADEGESMPEFDDEDEDGWDGETADFVAPAPAYAAARPADDEDEPVFAD